MDTDYGTLGRGLIVVDLTVEDDKDGYSTQGITELLDITGTGASGESYIGYPAYQSSEMILGVDEDSIIYDGTSRRGFLVFQTETSGDDIDWKLTSRIHENMEIAIEAGSIAEGLTVTRTVPERDEDFLNALYDALGERISDYEKTMDASAIGDLQEATEGMASGTEIPAPMISSYGVAMADAIEDVDDVKALLKSLRYIPGNPYDAPFSYAYSLEATLTQEFGSENEYANVALRLLSGLGYKPKPAVVTVNDMARELLSELAGVEVKVEYLPAVKYQDAGEEQVLVLPFVENLKDLDGLCFYDRDRYVEWKSEEAAVTLSFEVISKNTTRSEQFSDFTDALAGDSDTGSRSFLEEIDYMYIPLSELSKDAIDIGFVETGKTVQTYMITSDGPYWAPKKFSLLDYDIVGVVVQVDYNGRQYRHTTRVDGGRNIGQYFMTVGMNLPDLPEKAGEFLTQRQSEIHKEVSEATDLSALRWYGRNLLSQFIKAQTAYEAELASDLELVTGRVERPRMAVVTMEAPVVNEDGEDYGFEASVDLVDMFNEVHSDDDEGLRSFNIMSGLYMTKLEKEILGDKGYGPMRL